MMALVHQHTEPMESLAVFPTDSCFPCRLYLLGCSRLVAQGLSPSGSMGGSIFFCVFQDVLVCDGGHRSNIKSR